MTDNKTFDWGTEQLDSKPKGFQQLIKTPAKKQVNIAGVNNFSNDALTQKAQKARKNTTKEQEVEPFENKHTPAILEKATQSKAISPLLEKELLNILQYMPEFEEEIARYKRITFNQTIEALLQFYVENALSTKDQQAFQKDMDDEMLRLKRRYRCE